MFPSGAANGRRIIPGLQGCAERIRHFVYRCRQRTRPPGRISRSLLVPNRLTPPAKLVLATNHRSCSGKHWKATSFQMMSDYIQHRVCRTLIQPKTRVAGKAIKRKADGSGIGRI